MERAHPQAIAWLAGLLEGEGTFLRPPPSSPNSPRVALRMTDRDVVERAGSLFGVSVLAIDKRQFKTEYAAVAKGPRAAALMSDLYPWMGARRRQAITEAIEAYSPRRPVLAEVQRARIKARAGSTATISALARTYGVSRPTVREVVRGRERFRGMELPWRDRRSWEPVETSVRGLGPVGLAWLAGWLEGEGSFSAPPPSDPRRPRISGSSCDRDVLGWVAGLLDVSIGNGRDKRAAARGWAPTYRVLRAGRGAAELMRAMRPLLGERRSRQIDRALAATPAELGGSLESVATTEE